MVPRPGGQGLDGLDQGLADVGQAVLDVPGAVGVAVDQAVLLEPAEGLGEDLAGDAADEVDQLVVEPAAGEVRVRIEAFAVNQLDQLMRSGASPAPVRLPHARLGVEGTGVVDAVGPEVTGLAVGDPVIIAAVPDASVRGSYADYTTLPASRVFARPAWLEVIEAAAIWVAYSTAYGALVEKARMRPGDQVLTSAASGGVGRAAMQMEKGLHGGKKIVVSV